MNTISFVTANYVAQQVGYNMTDGWGQGDQTTQAYFQPLETFAARFDTLLADIKVLGFDAIDLWTAHLSPTWATDTHIALAQAAIEGYGLRVVSLAGGFGDSPAAFEATCRLAVALGIPVLGGSTPLVTTDQAAVVELLKRYGLRLAVENHPEKNPHELLAKIGDGAGGTIGAAIDTGWFGTQGYDAAQAIRELGPLVFGVHLKDVRAPGGHETVRYGQGCVPLRECVAALQEIGYHGPISVEHEPEYHEPTEDIRASLAMLRAWLQETTDQ